MGLSRCPHGPVGGVTAGRHDWQQEPPAAGCCLMLGDLGVPWRQECLHAGPGGLGLAGCSVCAVPHSQAAPGGCRGRDASSHLRCCSGLGPPVPPALGTSFRHPHAKMLALHPDAGIAGGTAAPTGHVCAPRAPCPALAVGSPRHSPWVQEPGSRKAVESLAGFSTQETRCHGDVL